jgi:outer membrane lipoprotein-sorting protein
VEEESGSIRTVTLEDIEPGANVPADYFKFTPPPGARVLAR